jgi:hypothetical protein
MIFQNFPTFMSHACKSSTTRNKERGRDIEEDEGYRVCKEAGSVVKTYWRDGR